MVYYIFRIEKLQILTISAMTSAAADRHTHSCGRSEVVRMALLVSRKNTSMTAGTPKENPAMRSHILICLERSVWRIWVMTRLFISSMSALRAIDSLISLSSS